MLFTGKVTVQIKNGFQFAVMKPLSIILGFEGKEVMLKKITESPYMADLTTGINHLRILGHCATPNRRRHEHSVTQKYSCRGKVW